MLYVHIVIKKIKLIDIYIIILSNIRKLIVKLIILL